MGAVEDNLFDFCFRNSGRPTVRPENENVKAENEPSSIYAELFNRTKNSDYGVQYSSKMGHWLVMSSNSH